MLNNTTGDENVADGNEALDANTSGHGNLASGFKALYSNVEGNFNVALGYRAGNKLTTGSNNVAISNEGAAGDEGTIRVGTEGTQSKTFIAGIADSSVSGCSVAISVRASWGVPRVKRSGALRLRCSRASQR